MTEYKVLVNGASAHDGNYTWSLPRDNGDGTYTPGAWTLPVDALAACKRGYHLTVMPMAWTKIGMTVYEAEGEGAGDTDADKTVYRRARLLRPAPEVVPDWWHAVEQFVVVELGSLPWLTPDGDPDPTWHLVTASDWAGLPDSLRHNLRTSRRSLEWANLRGIVSVEVGVLVGPLVGASVWGSVWGSVRDSVRDGLWDSVRDGLWDSVRDGLWDSMFGIIASSLPPDHPDLPSYRELLAERWRVWKKGYFLIGYDEEGRLVVGTLAGGGA